MQRKAVGGEKVLSLALSLFLFVGTVAPAFAAAPSSASLSTVARLEKIENSLLSRTQKGMSERERLATLENRVFGVEKTGSVSERLANLDTAVTSARSASNLLAPPMAPRLDKSAWSKAEEPKPQALSNYDEPDTASPADAATAMLKRATDLYTKGETAEAERMFKKVLSLDSRNADAHFNLGAISEARGDVAHALSEYRMANQINPADKEFRDAIAQIERRENADRIAKAEQQRQRDEHLREAAKRDNLKSMIAQASSAYKNGQYDSAARQLEAVVKQAPDDSDVRFALAQAYKAKGDLSKSRINLNQALAAQPNNKLYRDALTDLDQRIATGASGSASGTGNSGTSGNNRGYDNARAYDNSQQEDDGPSYAPAPRRQVPSDYIASRGTNYGSNSVDDGDGVQPFSPSPSYSGSASSSRRFDRGGIGSILAGGGGGTASVMKRAALGSITGAAMGAMWSRNSGGAIKSGMLKGALMGGMVGIFTGGL
ncbi:MAG: tetratricopeptide repeat protein [Candidatus Melainabacteria bacterium]|nr:tetratricopeptide repeat protein [Candidatus Melainabacteria bacterium]